jgi:hypothetical protein
LVQELYDQSYRKSLVMRWFLMTSYTMDDFQGILIIGELILSMVGFYLVGLKKDKKFTLQSQ